MIKLKYTFPLVVAAMLFFAVMPEDWHYTTDGRITQVVDDDSANIHEIHYVDSHNMTHTVEMFNYSSFTMERMREHDMKYSYTYRWYFCTWIYFGIICMHLFVYAIAQSCPDSCDYCPAYFLCTSKKRKTPINWQKFWGF